LGLCFAVDALLEITGAIRKGLFLTGEDYLPVRRRTNED
jgi:hypothetical protein